MVVRESPSTPKRCHIFIEREEDDHGPVSLKSLVKVVVSIKHRVTLEYRGPFSEGETVVLKVTTIRGI